MNLFVPSSPGTPGSSRAGTQGPADEASPQHVQFAASTIHVAHLADVLASVTAVHRHALMVLSQNGIAFYSEYNHIVNCHVAIDVGLFSAFRYEHTRRTEIGVDAQLLSDSFSAAAAAVPVRKGGAGDGVTCYIKYEGEGAPLVVEFEDRLMNEIIEFSTFMLETEYPYGDLAEEDRGLVLDHASLHYEVILQSDILVNLLLDLQHLNTQDLYMLISNTDENKVDFVSRGQIGYLKLEYPRARTMLQKLEVYRDERPARESVLCVLAFSAFIRIFRAVKLLSKCKIMEDSAGVLSFQLLCKNVVSTNYPGTLITCNMLEKTDLGDGAVPTAADLCDLFDESQYGNEERVSEPTVTYRSFQNPLVGAPLEIPFFL